MFYVIDWNKINGQDDSICVFDKNEKDNDNECIAHYGFDGYSHSVVSKGSYPENHKEYKELEEWQNAVNNRLGYSVDWNRLGRRGGSIEIHLD